MRTRAFAAGLIVAMTFGMTQPSLAQQAGRAELNEHMLPIAAGALMGAAVSFFVLPLIIPATAVAATAGVSATASPVVAVVGAGVGGFLGYELAR